MKVRKQLLSFALAVSMGLAFFVPVSAATKEEIKQEIQSLESQEANLKQKLADLKSSKNDIESYIEELDKEIDVILKNMDEISDEIISLDDEIHLVHMKLIEATANQAEQYKALKARIKAMYESGDNSILNLLLGGGDLGTFLNETDYREKVSSYDSKLLEKLEKNAKQIASYKDELEAKEKELEAKSASYEAKKKELEVILGEREQELTTVEYSISEMNEEIGEVRNKLDQEKDKMQKLIDDEKRKAEELKRKQDSAVAKITDAPPKVDKSTQTEEASSKKPESSNTGSTNYSGPKLTRSAGVVYGPSGKETYYNLNMSGVIRIMRNMGFSESEYPYWIREDGCKMLGDYIMCAANLNVHPRGTTVECSLGTCLVCDTGGFASHNSTQLDIATNW